MELVDTLDFGSSFLLDRTQPGPPILFVSYDMKKSKRKAAVPKSFDQQMNEIPVSKHPVLGMMIFSTGAKKPRGKPKT